MNMPLIEACVDSYASCRAAWLGGADRLELCAHLVIGGTTPSTALFRQVQRDIPVKTNVLIRPRFGDFLYSKEELEQMCEEIRMYRDLGANGVVIGALTPDGDLELESMRRMMDCAGGLDVTLIGLDSGTDRFDNLTLTVGSGTKLTLQDVRITGDRTLLSLAGKNTLTLLGRNELIGCADASGNACPTVVSGGDLTINGTGSLQLQALVNNAAFLGAEKSKISIEDCTLTLLKSDKLGFDGGAFCANGADVTLTNASFSGRTDSDNVAVLSAETVTVTGGTLRVEAEKSVHAVLGRVSLTNCGLYASGHSGNSAKTVSQTTGVEALQTLAQQSGVRTLAASGFADVRAEDACLQDVLTCTAAGLMTGTGQDRFSPEKPMTRAMLVTVLWRMAGSPAAQGNGGFTDLRADWYRQAAVWGAQNGIVSGTSRTTFAPDKAVTKEQACALLARFARTRGVQAAADAAPVYVAECSAWAGSDVQSAYARGIADSYAACLAAPQASATRAELAHMLSDLLQRV